MSRPTAHPALSISNTGDRTTGPEYIEAFKNMTALVPRFTDIVRLAAEDTSLQVLIRPNEGPATNGNQVVIPLDVEYAKVDPKSPCTCDHDTKCAYHVTVGYLLHEAAHISEGSTVEVTPALIKDVLDAFDRLGAYIGPAYVERALASGRRYQRVTLEAMTLLTPEEYDSMRVKFVSFLEVCAGFNRHASGVCNALEDARINKVMGLRRTALDQVMQEILKRIVISTMGVEGADDYGQLPLGYQVAVGMEVKMEHDVDLAPLVTSQTVSKALGDDVLQRILTNPDLFKSTADCVAASIVITDHLRREYGIYTETAGDGRAGAQMKSGRDTGDDGKLKPSQQVRENRELEKTHDDAIRQSKRNAKADTAGRSEWAKEHSTLEPDDNPDRTELNKALGDALDKLRPDQSTEGIEDSMTTPGGSGYLTVTESGDGSYRAVVLRPDLTTRLETDYIQIGSGYKYSAQRSNFGDIVQELDTSVALAVSRSERALAGALGLNRRSANVPNLPSGRLHGSKLAKVPSGGRRVFRRVDKPAKRSYAVLIGVDQSGSTRGSCDDYLRELAYGQAAMLDKLGIPFAVAGHTGNHYSRWTDSRSNPEWQSESAYREMVELTGQNNPSIATIQLIKNFAEPWDLRAKAAHAALQGSLQNLDGITMRAYINMLCAQRATDRILLYYTDGAMPAEDSSHQRVILKSECRRAKAMAMLPDRRLHLIGVGVGTDSPKEYGLDTIEVPDDKDSREYGLELVVSGLAERIAKTIK